jgi:hypothetical protein
MATARKSTYIWTSWLARLMAGQQACEFCPWFKAHYQYEKLSAGDFDAAAWTMEHARLLRKLRLERLQARETVYMGNSNSFRYEPRAGVILAGRPDLVGDDYVRSPVIYLVKTGRAKISDWLEATILMHVVPLAVERYRGTQMRGCIAYPDDRVPIAESAVDSEFVDNFEYFLGILAGDNAPPKSPSEGDCRFCNISALDCPERWQEARAMSKPA